MSNLPPEILVQIFGCLPPYLWIYPRAVCQKWKDIIEEGIIKTVKSKAVIQMISCENTGIFWYPAHELSQAIYRCTDYQPRSKTFTFGPLEGLGAYCVDSTRQRNGLTMERGWMLLDINCSLFPKERKRCVEAYYLNINSMAELSYKARVNVWESPDVVRKRKWTQKDIDDFHSQTSSVSKGKLHEKRWVNLRFARPEVDLDLLYRSYKLKCRYSTKLILQQEGKIEEAYTLTIEKIEIKLSDLMKWQCSCGRPRCVYNRLPLKAQPEKKDSEECLLPENHPLQKQTFSVYPHQDGEFWKEKVDALGDLRVTGLFSQKLPVQRVPSLRFCPACLKFNPGKENAASSSCHYRFCGQHCSSRRCTRHVECARCREIRLGFLRSGEVGGICRRHRHRWSESYKVQCRKFESEFRKSHDNVGNYRF